MVKKAANEEVIATSKPAKKDKLPRSSEDKKSGGTLRYTLTTVVACIVVITIGAVTVKTLVIDAGNQTYGNKLAGTYVRQYAGYFNQIFLQASRQLSGIVSSRQVVATMAEGDPHAMAQLSETLAASLAGHSQVYMVPGSMALADVPLGFAARNMVDRARSGEDIKAEIIPLQERPLLLLASGVRDASQQIVGVLLVGFDLKEIATNLEVFNAETGYMSLSQYMEEVGESKVVMSRGPDQFQSSPYQETIDTLHPNIRVTYYLNPGLASSDTGQLFLIAMAAMMLLVIVAIFASSALLARALSRNASMLVQYGESLLRRAPRPAGIQFDLSLFEDAAASLARTAALQPTGSGSGPTAISTARRARGDIDTDITPEDASHLASGTHAAPSSLAPEIFRAYDIRGVVGKTLTEETMRLLGRAIGSEAIDKKQQAIYVGRDGRLSGPQLMTALTEGLVAAGCRVIDLGMVPTPLVYFACANGNVKSGIVLTGSHNPADHNGLKIVIDGETLAEARIQALKERIVNNQFRSGKGSQETLDIAAKYTARVKEDVVLARSMKVVLDCGNGVAGAIAPSLLGSIGCEVIPLYCDVDGNFPNHHPDPSKPENLRELIAKVSETKADIGLAFDGDGDRIGVVTPKGKIIFPDRLMMLFAKDLLMRSPGADIIFDVKCTRDLADVISQNGGRPLMWRTGHSLIKAKMKEIGAPLAGEMSGHIFFNDRWFGFDDAIYAAARLLEILSLEVATADDVFAEFPANVSTPEIQLKVPEADKFRIIEQLQKQGGFGSDGSVSTIDGVRVDYPNSWGLARASNTTSSLVFRFEGRTAQDLQAVRALFQEQLKKVAPGLTIPA